MGRDTYSHRRVLEFSAGVRIQDLKNYGLLNRGSLKASWNYSITRSGGLYKENLADVTFTVQLSNTDRLSDKNFIQFEYNYQGQPVSFKQPIEIQPVHLGGYRYYFRCNCTKNGRYCGRRVKALYFGGNIWACRHCLELVYQNSRYHRDEVARLWNNAEVLQKKADTLRTFKHPRKASRLEWKAYDYEFMADEAFLIRTAAFLKRIEKR